MQASWLETLPRDNKEINKAAVILKLLQPFQPECHGMSWVKDHQLKWLKRKDFRMENDAVKPPDDAAELGRVPSFRISGGLSHSYIVNHGESWWI